eukprot:Nk52_evm15s255 gene=Nk52_evmTU15s255
MFGLCISYAETGIQYYRVSKTIQQKHNRNAHKKEGLFISEKLEREYATAFAELGLLKVIDEGYDGPSHLYTVVPSKAFPRSSSLEILCSVSTRSEEMPTIDDEFIFAEDEEEYVFEEPDNCEIHLSSPSSASR